MLTAVGPPPPVAEPLTALDFYHLKNAGGVNLSPDGRRAVFVVTEVDSAENRYRRDLWIANTAEQLRVPEQRGNQNLVVVGRMAPGANPRRSSVTGPRPSHASSANSPIATLGRAPTSGPSSRRHFATRWSERSARPC